MRAFASLQLYSAVNLPRPQSCAAQELGQFGLRPELLLDVLMGTRVQLGTAEGPFWRTLAGEASPHDLEPALQLMHMLFRHQLRAVPAELRTCLKCAPVSSHLQGARGLHVQTPSMLCMVSCTWSA